MSRVTQLHARVRRTTERLILQGVPGSCIVKTGSLMPFTPNARLRVSSSSVLKTLLFLYNAYTGQLESEFPVTSVEGIQSLCVREHQFVAPLLRGMWRRRRVGTTTGCGTLAAGHHTSTGDGMKWRARSATCAVRFRNFVNTYLGILQPGDSLNTGRWGYHKVRTCTISIRSEKLIEV